MQRNIGKPQFVLSGLCIALLTACGGGGDDMLLDKDGARPGFTGTDKSNVPLDPVGHNSITPPVNIFVTAKSVGQQNSPRVVALDNNSNGKVDSSDAVKFDQPAIVSEFCPAGDCIGFKDRQQKANELKEAMDDAWNKVESAKTALEENTDLKKAGALQQKLDAANVEYKQKAADFYNSGLSTYVGFGDKRVTMRDVNNDFRTVNTFNTIDMSKLLTGHKDAGVTQINKKRTRTSDGKPVDRPYGGSTGSLFNEVVLFGLDKNKAVLKKDGTVVPSEQSYMDSYFRSSSTAGWSFQTFGYFFSNQLARLRNVSVGFQSVGDPAKPKELPAEGKATYRGISQAYFNDKQVTMENQIDANFSKRELTYTTTKPALYHTFEGPGGEGTTGDIHVIEERPELNLTGHANWAKGVSKFQGEIHSGNGLHGTLQGQFYGPQAPEVGGVYGMQGTVNGQVVQYVGGFGAARD